MSEGLSPKISCFLCGNTNMYQGYIQSFWESFEKIQENDLFENPQKYQHAHLICSCFYLDLELFYFKEPLPQLDPEHPNPSFRMVPILHNTSTFQTHLEGTCMGCGLNAGGI